MKSAGRPVKPTNLKLVQGTLRPERTSRNEPRPEMAIPAVPPHLSDEAKLEWGRISQELYNLGLLSGLDRAALTAYCDCWSDYVEAATKVRQMGMVVTTKQIVLPDGTKQGGNIVENPFYSIKKRSLELMYRFLTEFGLSPSSRAGLDANPPAAPAPVSRWSEFNKNG